MCSRVSWRQTASVDKASRTHFSADAICARQVALRTAMQRDALAAEVQDIDEAIEARIASHPMSCSVNVHVMAARWEQIGDLVDALRPYYPGCDIVTRHSGTVTVLWK